MRFIRQKLVLILSIVSMHYVKGQDERSFTFITDQDFFYISPSKNEDRNYTQGTSFTLSDDRLFNTILYAPFKGYNNLRGKIFKKQSVNSVMTSISLLGTAFTPRKIDSINPIIGDRPFAFLLATSFNNVNRIGDKFGHRSNYEVITVNIGLLGTDVGYDFQSFAHTYLVPGRPKDPIGWNTQISKGGKFTLLLNYERIWFFSLFPTKNQGWGIDGSINLGGSLGYYDRAYIGTYLRFGYIDQFNMPNWMFFGNSLATSNKKSAQASPASSNGAIKKRKYEGIEFFGFLRITNNFMFRNSLLVGQTYTNDDIYTLEKSWAKTYFYDIDFGLAFGIYWIKNSNEDEKHKFLRLVYKNTIRSPEFDSGIFPKRKHYFGSIGLQFSI